MELISQCFLRAAKLLWRPGHGGFAFTVVCKATFDLANDLSPIAAVQEPVWASDVWSASDPQSLAIASDLVPFKKRPEVLLTGHAYAPGGLPVPSLVARLRVDDMDKAIQVDGDRYFDQDGWITDPEPFSRMPLVWSRAAGGPGTANPAGVLFGNGARPDPMGRIIAPNLLPLGLFLTSRWNVVPPVGFGPLAPSWPVRTTFLQEHAALWDPTSWNERPLPSGVDVAYFNAAPPDQQRNEPFSEPQIVLENLHPRVPRFSTRLASVTPTAVVDRGLGPEPLRLRCDTLIIDTDRAIAMIVFRAHVLLDRPDRPGHVLINAEVASARPEPSRAPWTASEPLDRKATVLPSQMPRSKAPSPFLRSTAVMDAEATKPAPPVLPFAAGPKAEPPPKPEPRPPRASAIPAEFRRTATIDPSQVMVNAQVLPFNEPEQPIPKPLGAGMTLRRTSPPPTDSIQSTGSIPQSESPDLASPATEDTTMPLPAGTLRPYLEEDTFVEPSRRGTLGLSHQDETLPGAGRSSVLPFVSASSTAYSSADDRTAAGIHARRAVVPFEPPSGEPETAQLSTFSPPMSPVPFTPMSPVPFTPMSPPAAAVYTAHPPAPKVTASADSAAERIRVVQQAIWRGDRPTREILAEHNLTEVEWRALKRSQARSTKTPPA